MDLQVKSFYKRGRTVTLRKPCQKKKDSYVHFSVVLEGKRQEASVRQFLKYVVTDLKELILLKNDVCFLMNDLKYSKKLTHTVQSGVVLYVWVYLPYQYSNEVSCSIKETVYYYDLFCISQGITDKQFSEILTTLQLGADVRIFKRRIGDNTSLPFPIKVIV